jgi:hypothetical protein
MAGVHQGGNPGFLLHARNSYGLNLEYGAIRRFPMRSPAPSIQKPALPHSTAKPGVPPNLEYGAIRRFPMRSPPASIKKPALPHSTAQPGVPPNLEYGAVRRFKCGEVVVRAVLTGPRTRATPIDTIVPVSRIATLPPNPCRDLPPASSRTETGLSRQAPRVARNRRDQQERTGLNSHAHTMNSSVGR